MSPEFRPFQIEFGSLDLYILARLIDRYIWFR